MATQVQSRRGTTAQHATFTGASGELTVDTDKKTVVVHDGTTAGGAPLLRENGSQNAVTTGTSTAASFIPTSSTVPSNGVYLPSANNVAISTNGTGQLFIDASGRVGVNKSSLSQTFHVKSSSGGTTARFENSSTGNFIDFYETTGNTRMGYIGHPSATDMTIHNDKNGPIVFETNNTERMRLDSSGRLGLGESAPESILHLKGSSATLKIENSVNTGYSGVEFDRAADDTHFAIYAYDSSHATQANNVQFYGYQNGRLDFHTNSSASPRLSIASGGNVGIGDTGPDATLVTKGAGISDVAFAIKHAWGSSSTALMTASNGSGEVMRLQRDGKLLVGTSTSRLSRVYYPGGDGALASTGQIEGIGNVGSLQIVNNQAGTVGASIVLGKSRGTSVGSITAVTDGDQLGTIQFNGIDVTTTGDLESCAASIQAQVDGTPGANDMPGRLVFSTTADGASSPTERMRIAQNGQLDTYGTPVESAYTARISYGAGTIYGFFSGRHSASSTGTGTNTFFVYTNGNVVNSNNSYGQLSDIKLKENVVDANSQWDDLKAVRVRNFNFKTDQTHRQIGVIAQELEEVSPGLVYATPDRDDDGNETGEVTKGVNYSVLYMKAVKALQEAMERIEALEIKVAALEAS